MPELIKCPSCGFDNATTQKQCTKCKTILPQETLYQKLLKTWQNLTKKEVVAAVVSEFKGEVGSTLKTEKNEKLTVLKNIGSGSYGEVLLVEKEKNKQKFAVKLLRMWNITPKERKNVENRFLQEYKVAKMAKDVGSPYLVHALDKGYANGNPFFLMEYCAGGSLRDNIKNWFTEVEIRNIAVSILKGLVALHGQGIIHRDLKPENILFDEDKVKLTDFGISGYLNSRMTKTNFDGSIKFTLGTDAYIPPEQFDRSNAFKTMGSVTDIFAFGIVMFEMITNGKFPYGPPPEFDEKNQEPYNQAFEAYCQRVRTDNWELLNTLRGNLVAGLWADIIKKCIVADYKKRSNSAEELLVEITQQRISGNLAVKEATASPDYLLGNKYLLRVMNGWQPDLVFNLTDMMTSKGYLTIGRFDEDEPELNDIGIIEIEDPYFISRTQATFEVGEKTGNWYIRDGQYRKIGSKPQWIASRNGTYLNSVSVDAKGVTIKAGDIITIGDTTLRIEKTK
jgi:serine/threonine protein kinase